MSKRVPKPKLPAWRVKAASVPGASHRKVGKECQDYNCWRITSGGTLIVAVADGAGTAPWGAEGAKLASTTAVAALENFIANQDADGIDWSRGLQDALVEARERLKNEAIMLGVNVAELATTLILVAATPNLVAAAQIGDGACVAANVDGAMRTLGAPPRGEYLNETVFLVSDRYEAAMQKTLWPDRVAHLAIFSDGLQMLAMKMADNTPHAPFFEPLWGFADQEMEPEIAEVELNGLLLSPRVAGRTDDDLTLVLASLILPAVSARA
jgi:hypothetical protein